MEWRLLCVALATFTAALGSAARSSRASKENPTFFLQDTTDGLCLAGSEWKRCGADTLWYVEGNPGKYQVHRRPVDDKDDELCLNRKTCDTPTSDLRLASCSHCGSKKWNILGDQDTGYVLSESGQEFCMKRNEESKKPELIKCDDGYTTLSLHFTTKYEVQAMTSPGARLVAAAAAGDADGVLAMLLDEGAEVEADSLDWDRTTPLIAAAGGGHLKVVELLVERGADPAGADKDGVTALMEAAAKGDLPVVAYLCDRPLEIDQTASSGATALWLAAGEGRTDVVRHLLEHGADPRVSRDDGISATMAACVGGHLPVVEALLDAGADVEERDGDQVTPLMNAAENGSLPLIEVLLGHGADAGAMSDSGFTPLIVAAAGGHLDVCKLFVEREKVDVNAMHESGVSALMYAAAGGHAEVVGYLVARGADVNAVHVQNGSAAGGGGPGGGGPGGGGGGGEWEGNVLARAVWRVGADQFLRDFRHAACARLAGEKLNAAAQQVMAALLRLSAPKERQACEEQSAPASVREIYAALPPRDRPEWGLLTKYLELLRADGARLVAKVAAGPAAAAAAGLLGGGGAGEGGRGADDGPRYAANLGGMLRFLRQRAIHGMVEDRLGLLSARIFFVLLDKQYLEDTQVGELAMVPARECRARLLRLQREGLAALQEVPKRADRAPGATLYLWTVDARRAQGGSALMEAATAGGLDVMKVLVEAGADYHIKDNDAVTPLMSAASQQQRSLHQNTEKLIDSNKESQLRGAAATKGHLNVTEYLVGEKGVGPDARANSGGTALMFAAGGGHLQVCKYLLEKGVDVNAAAIATPEYLNQINEAIAAGNTDVEPHTNGVTSLMVAALGGHSEVVKLLLEHGADPTMVDENGGTALENALKVKDIEAAQALVEAGASPDIRYEDDEGKKHNPLLDALHDKNEGFATALVQKGAPTGQKDRRGRTALVLAAEAGLASTVAALLAREDLAPEDLDAETKEGETALLRAAHQGHAEVVSLLVHHPGAKLHKRDKDGSNALMSAALRGHLGVVKVLLGKGFQVNRQNKQGHTALMFANHGRSQARALLSSYGDYLEAGRNSTLAIQELYENHDDIVNILLRHGADPALQDKEGHTAADFDFNSVPSTGGSVGAQTDGNTVLGADEL